MEMSGKFSAEVDDEDHAGALERPRSAAYGREPDGDKEMDDESLVQDTVFERQRYMPRRGFAGHHLHGVEPFVSLSRNDELIPFWQKEFKDDEAFRQSCGGLPEGDWHWVGEWQLERSIEEVTSEDDDCWIYAFNWPMRDDPLLKWWPKEQAGPLGVRRQFVRMRKWTRKRQRCVSDQVSRRNLLPSDVDVEFFEAQDAQEEKSTRDTEGDISERPSSSGVVPPPSLPPGAQVSTRGSLYIPFDSRSDARDADRSGNPERRPSRQSGTRDTDGDGISERRPSRQSGTVAEDYGGLCEVCERDGQNGRDVVTIDAIREIGSGPGAADVQALQQASALDLPQRTRDARDAVPSERV